MLGDMSEFAFKKVLDVCLTTPTTQYSVILVVANLFAKPRKGTKVCKPFYSALWGMLQFPSPLPSLPPALPPSPLSLSLSLSISPPLSPPCLPHSLPPSLFLSLYLFLSLFLSLSFSPSLNPLSSHSLQLHHSRPNQLSCCVKNQDLATRSRPVPGYYHLCLLFSLSLSLCCGPWAWKRAYGCRANKHRG